MANQNLPHEGIPTAPPVQHKKNTDSFSMKLLPLLINMVITRNICDTSDLSSAATYSPWIKYVFEDDPLLWSPAELFISYVTFAVQVVSGSNHIWIIRLNSQNP